MASVNLKQFLSGNQYRVTHEHRRQPFCLGEVCTDYVDLIVFMLAAVVWRTFQAKVCKFYVKITVLGCFEIIGDELRSDGR